MQIDVYSVPLLELLALPGSGRQDLVATIRDECDLVGEIDDMIDRDEVEKPLTFMDAVTRIIDGDPLTGLPEFVYGYAFEAICWGLGSTLCRVMNYFHHDHDELDRFLEQAGVPVSFHQLKSAGPLLAVPSDGDLPYMGWWTPDQIARASARLGQLSLQDVAATLADDVRKIQGWLTEALDQAGDCIVSFQIDY